MAVGIPPLQIRFLPYGFIFNLMIRQVILATMLGEVPLSQAVDDKLIHAELRPDIVEIYESGFDQVRTKFYFKSRCFVLVETTWV